MMTPLSKLSAAIIVASSLAACGGGSSGGSSTPPPVDPGPSTPELNLSGTAVKGILANATVVAYTLDKSTELLRTTTDEKGLYSLAGIETTGPVLVELTTNSNTVATCDSAVGCGEGIKFGDTYAFNDSAFVLSAVLPSAASATDQKLMITPLTHLAAQRIAEQGLSTAADIQTAADATAALFGLEGIDINTLAPVDITDPAQAAAAGKEAQLYASLVASVATLAAQDDERSIADVINELADDYAADGGLTANSADEDKLTLSQIFEESVAVVKAAEEKAADENVQLDMDFAETTLETSGQEADAQTPDSEITEPVEPTDPTDPEPTEEEKKAAAVAKGISLLEDLNTWEDALRTVEDQTLTQPFVEQLESADSLLTALDDQSQLLRKGYQLIGKNVSVQECDWYLDENTCAEYYQSTEFEAGPVIGAVEFLVNLGGLTVFVDDLIPPVETTVNFSLAEAIQNGYSTGAFDYLTETSTNMQIQIVPDLQNPGKRTFNYTYTQLSESETEVMSATLVRNEADDNLTASYRLESLDIVFADQSDASQSFEVKNTSGSVSLAFDNAVARSNFVAALRNGTTPSITGANDLTIQLTTQTVSENTTADLEVNISADQSESANQDSVSASISIDLNDSVTEEMLSGTFTTSAFIDLAEQNLDSGFVQSVFAKSAAADFEGELGLFANGTMAQFQGRIEADASLLSAENVEDNAQFDEANARFIGTLSLSNNGDAIVFNGNISATMESVRTPQGVPFKLNGEKEYFLTRAGFIGDLDVSNQDGEAALGVNMVVVADIAGLSIDQPALPQEGDAIAQLNYGFEEIDEDNVRYFVNRGQAIQQALNALNNEHVTAELSYTYNNEDQSHGFQRSDCIPSADGNGQFCNLTITSKQSRHLELPSNPSTQQVEDGLQQSLSIESDYTDDFADPDTTLETTAGSASASCDGTFCSVSKDYSGSYEFPANILSYDSRTQYLRGQALTDHDERAAELQVSDCNANGPYESCTISRTSQEEQWIDNSYSNQTRVILAEGAYRYFSRNNGLSSCLLAADPALATCNLDLGSITQYVYSSPAGGATTQERIANLITAGTLRDTFNQSAVEGGILESDYFDNGDGTFSAAYEFVSTSVTVDIPAELVYFYEDGSGHPIHEANQYLNGIYGSGYSDNINVEFCEVDSSRCLVTVTSYNNWQYQEPGLTQDQKKSIYLGRYELDYSIVLAEACTDDTTLCDFTLTQANQVDIPDNIAPEYAEQIAINMLSGAAKSYANPQLTECYENQGQPTAYCNVSYQETHVKAATYFDNQSSLVDFITANFEQNGLSNNIYLWADFETNYGYLDINGWSYFNDANAFFAESLTHSIDLTVQDFYNEFILPDFETDDAYIELSAHLEVDASVTGLEDAQVGIQSNRLGREDADARITLNYGLRTVVIELDSLAAFDDIDENKITIANGDAEMTVVANCIKATDVEVVDACESGFNFEGDIFVDGYKVADLEDRKGIPVFKFDDGSDYELVVTPNFIVNEL